MLKNLWLAPLLVFSSLAHSATPVLDIAAADIDRIRIHTSLIIPTTSQNVITVKTTKMKYADGNCASGGYIPFENNNATYSAILATYMAGKNFSIQYDTEQHMVGSNAYCAILYFDVVR
ncbi:MAG: hypothetical protein MJK04_30195 [Psychrosphaera sp.]|nr:hypothetical protein [Psychrosphaera sp.]